MTATGRSLDRRVGAACVAAALALAPAACKQADAVEVEHYQASSITPGEDGEHPTVTITELAAEQVGLETVMVKKTKVGTSVPYASVLYDAEGGQPYVFINPEGLTFHREDVDITGIDGDTVHLAKGPAVGTRVVTVGLPQIHGAELEFGAY